MRNVLVAITAAVIAVSSSTANSAQDEQPRRVPATELEKNAAAYRGQRISVDQMACAYVQGLYVCAHQSAGLIVIASVRPPSFQEYVERGCGTASSPQDRCTVVVTFRIEDVKWEARPGQVRTAVIASGLDLATP